MSVTAIPMMGQDLIARQAPIDKKMKAVDSVALNRLIQTEQMETPAADLYEDWNNKYAHRATELPDTFRIDLRDFCMPTTNRVVTSNLVRYDRNGYGNYVVIRHGNGLETIYGHMSKQLVEENQVVAAGEPIGLGGNTGRSTGSHLHFETRLCGVALNPAIMFDFHNQDVIGDYYMFYKNRFESESVLANRLRGVGGGGNIGENEEDLELAIAAPEAKYAKDVKFHKVAAGETLSSIAKKRGTTVDALCKLNHIGKRIRLMPGQILKYN